MTQQTQNQNISPIPNCLKFSQLPKQIQQRLLERQCGNGEGFAFKTKGIASAYFFTVAAIGWIGIVLYFANDYLWSDFRMAIFSLVSFTALYLLVQSPYKLFQWFSSSSKNYLLITPHYVIEMNFDDVCFWDLDQLNSVKSVHQNQDGKYAATQINLLLANNLTKTFEVKNIDVADETIEEINHYKKLFAEATARNDAAYLDANDDFIELQNQPLRQQKFSADKYLKYIATATGSIFLTAGMMFGAISLNNYFDDKKSWNDAEFLSRASSYRKYLQTHSQGRWANEARQKVQKLYDEAEQKYQTSLNNGYDQKAVDAVLQTLNYAETTQSYRVKLVFERHNEISPNIVEELKRDYEVKKVLPFDDTFSEDKMVRRESSLLRVVTDAFKQVIADDILEFSSECAGDNCVTFIIKYTVSSKDSLYYDPREKKLPEAERTWNPGIFIDWDFAVRIPEQSQTYNFSLASKPAEHITYDSNAEESFSGKVDVEKEMQVDKNNLYDSMVASAFDDFRKSLVFRMGIGEEPKPNEVAAEDETALVTNNDFREMLGEFTRGN